MNIDWAALLPQMLQAAQPALEESWVQVGPYAANEFTKMEHDLDLIQQLVSSGQISQDEAKLQFQMQKNSMQAVLLTVEGVGLIEAAQAINSALNVIADVVNTTVGFTLIALL